MNEVDPRRHPAPENLAAFVDGALVATELKEVASHLRECGECRDIAGETARFQEEVQSAGAAPKRWWIPAAIAAAIAIAFIPLWQKFSDPLPRVQPRDRRLVQARLTGFDYAPYRPMRS